MGTIDEGDMEGLMDVLDTDVVRTSDGGGIPNTAIAFDVAEGEITAVWAVVYPDKMLHLWMDNH